MKNTICFLVGFLLAAPAYCQVVAIQNDMRNVITLGLENPLTVAVEKCPSRSISLTTNNGIITGDNGHYLITPKHFGVAMITINKKTWRGLKVIDSMYFRVKRVEVSVTFGGHKGGQMSKEYVCLQIAPVATIEGFPIDAKCTIDSFTVIVKRNDNIIFSKDLHNASGTRIDKETRAFFKTTQDKDKLIITNLTYKDIDGVSIHVPPMEFIITPATYTESDTIVDPITGQEISRKYFEEH